MKRIQLELPYLLSVIQLFESHSDLYTFLQINKKCEGTLYALKKNPPFENEKSMKWFFTHFEVDTVDMTCMNWSDIDVLQSIQCIRNPELFHAYFKTIISKENIKELVKKTTRLRLKKLIDEEKEKKIQNELNKLYITNAISFERLDSLDGDLLLIVSFLERYTNHGKEQYVKLPRKILIDSYDGEEIELKKIQIESLKQLEKLLPIHQDIQCDIILKEQCIKENVLNQFKRFTFWCHRLIGNTSDVIDQKVLIMNGCCSITKYLPSNTINRILNQCHCDELVLEQLKKKKIEQWDIPTFISKLTFKASIAKIVLSNPIAKPIAGILGPSSCSIRPLYLPPPPNTF